MRLGNSRRWPTNEDNPPNYVLIEPGDKAEDVVKFARENQAIYRPTSKGFAVWCKLSPNGFEQGVLDYALEAAVARINEKACEQCKKICSNGHLVGGSFQEEWSEDRSIGGNVRNICANCSE
ncbi:hypothetical protein COT97_02645 [Candidatus Falkowbacteria bacterium CG10_big_fil_rev_8_21_14_0_10_39_11]|uniref:Uncharacterized protein n=1 Tax=Candidatus Falkowbacteria bacterium CG10_big_fil_rev_8_21_14_0_10_39_11 TaxID=1974565 RepID=A0A2H0V567_9BACT|nr:MAG: hypothetical protein COT97_02645 [Candidatus Falkowbacteria bacterium CG10_big_fil_rev_8_21_14_0_10_39_11]